MELLCIRYSILLDDGSEKVFDLSFNAESLSLLSDVPEHLPDWTELKFHQCPNCPLTNPLWSRCPLAVHLAGIVGNLGDITSYDTVDLSVVTQERSISQRTSAQRAISSLIGLVSATSGCPHTEFFKPMARFHLPLASEEETVYRATSMYLLAQYFMKQEGKNPDFDLQQLKAVYGNIMTVNHSFAGRLRAASHTDLTVNAIILLDVYAKSIPYFVDEVLERIRPLYKPFLQD
jgi:hypothetical protein